MGMALSTHETDRTDLGVSSFATQYRRYDRMLARFGRRMLEAVDLKPMQRVVDVGCGAGTLTLDIARRVGPNGRVIGIDLGEDVIEVARSRARARRLSNTRFVVGDATRHRFPRGRIDAVTSRFGSCRFDDAVEGYANLRRSLRRGGKLAFVCPREAQRNPWATVPYRAVRSVLPELLEHGGAGPFGLSDQAQVKRVLHAAGFRDVTLTSIDDPVCVGEDVDDALEFFFETDGRELSGGLEDDALRGVTRALRSAIAPYDGEWGVWMPASVWLVVACNE
jgi:ubiquinone/menaquinone biosynthesis C-methylase UbiE